MNNSEAPPPYYCQINNRLVINNVRPKTYDRNIYTASVHVITIILIWMSMLQSDWFQIDFGNCKSHLSIKQFVPELPFGRSVLNISDYDDDEEFQGKFIIYERSSTFCPTIDPSTLPTNITSLMRLALYFCVWSIFFSATAFYLDILGSFNSTIKIIRRNSLLGIITVLLVSFLIADCYYVSVLLGETLDSRYPGYYFSISYGSGFYTITAAGVVAAMATSITLLLAPLPTDDIIAQL